MLAMQYPATIRQDKNGRDWVVSFPDLDGALTGAETEDQAILEAADCLASWMAFALVEGRDIPKASKLAVGQQLVPIPLWIAPKVALYQTMKKDGITNVELARRLSVRETVVRRMLDPEHATRARNIEAALLAVGRKVIAAVAAA